MRAALVLCSLAAVLTACIARPQLEPFAEPDQVTLPTSASPGSGAAPGSDPTADASTEDVAIPIADDASVPQPPPTQPPPPAPTTCPPAGAPAGTMCCGANGAAPPCIGMACEHCGDCVSQGCAAGMICCAVSPGGSGKYKGMSCRVAALAGTCPKASGGND